MPIFCFSLSRALPAATTRCNKTLRHNRKPHGQPKTQRAAIRVTMTRAATTFRCAARQTPTALRDSTPRKAPSSDSMETLR